jgi:GntR family transcriptional repressor for pyruvate dehydrogenase complex
MNIEPIAQNSLVDQVAERIRGVIGREKLQAGDRLPTETALARQLCVSRSVLREAISRLEAMGLLDVRRGRGTFVGDRHGLARCIDLVKTGMTIAPKEMMQFSEFRKLIEVHSSRRAAELASPEDLAELETHCNEMDREDLGRVEAIRADFRFHRKLVEIAGNELMLNVFEVIQEFILAGMEQTTPVQRNRERSRRLHRAILDGVRNGNPDEAERAMQVHMQSVDVALLKIEKS